MKTNGRRSALRSALTTLLLVGLVMAGCGQAPSNHAVLSVRIDEGPRTLEVGSTLALAATVVTSGGAAEAVTWASSDERVATVEADGVVTGIAAGAVDITATSD